MSTNLLHEDGYENVIDENGDPEPMDYIIDQRKFITGTIATHTEYLKTALSNESSMTCPMLENPKDEDIPIKKASTKLDYVRSTVQDRFFDLKIEKRVNASAAAKQLDVHIRTAQG